MDVTKSDAFCDGEFCTLIEKFEVPKEGILSVVFYDYLSQHGAQSGVVINTKGTILQNKRCPFCRFAAVTIRGSHYAEAHEESECTARLQHGPSLWLEILAPDATERTVLLRLGERIVLLTPKDRASAVDGRLYDRNGVDFTILRNWLRLCRELHQGVCSISDDGAARATRTDIPKVLRVVDVVDHCLTDIPWSEQYVALSYVWGEAEPPKLFQDRLPDLYVPGSLSQQKETMPNTIKDSMTLTSGLGLRYLWFDSLCLVQDRPDDLKAGVQNMDMVYESAFVTIVAANGPGADSGLPGVGQTPRSVQQQTHILKPGLEITNVFSLDQHLNQSTWATRGWTLQEHYLSRRIINFVNGQAYFRCRQRIWCEELWTDTNPKLQDSSEWVTNLVAMARESMDLKEGIAVPHDYLFLAVGRFQQRFLKHDADAINVMTGILRRVADMAHTEIVNGLPADLFPLSLNFWHAQEGRVRRRNQFPSWSWAGWAGGNSQWHAFMQLNIYQHPNELDDALKLTCAFIRTHDPKSLEGAGRTFWLPERSLLEQSDPYLFEPNQTRYEYVNVEPVSSELQLPYTLLSITAVCMFVKVEIPPSHRNNPEKSTTRLYIITGKKEHICGYAFLDEALEGVEACEMELFLLSQCFGNASASPGLEHEAETREPVFWALLVSPMSNGVYERKGVGQILRSSISCSQPPGPRWQRLLLG